MGNARIGALRVDLGANTAAFEKGLDLAERKMNAFAGKVEKLGKKMSSLGKSLTKSITLPIVGMGVAVVKTAGDFEMSMNKVEAATGAAGSELAAMRDQALAFGRDKRFTSTAKEAADTMEILAKNGLTASQIMGGAAEAALVLAAATGSDFASAGDLATDIMQQFGKDASALADVTDKVTGALLVSKFGFDDYRLAIGQAGGVAGGLGLSFEEMNTAIAATSSYFASGSDAGTSFKNFLVSMSPRSQEAAALMQQYGLSFFDAAGNMKDLAEISEMLRTKLGGLSEAARTEVMRKIFGTDAMRTAIGLMKQGAEGIREVEATINKASALDQAAARTKGFNGAMKQLMKSLEGLAIALADSGFLDWLTNIILKLSDFMRGLSDTDKSVLKWSVAVAGIAAAVGPVLSVLGALAQGFKLLVPILKMLGPLFTMVRVAAIALMAHPVILGFAAVATGIYLAWKNWDKIGPILSNLYISAKKWLLDKLGGVLNWVKHKVEAVEGAFAWVYDKVVGNSWVPDMVDAIGDHFARLDKLMVDPAIKATETVSDRMRAMATEVRELLGRLFPDIELARQYASDLALIDGAKMSESEKATARKRLSNEKFYGNPLQNGPNSRSPLEMIPSKEWKIEGQTAVQILTKVADKAKVQTVRIAKSFKDMAQETMSALKDMVSAIKSGDFLDILSGLVNMVMQLGSIGLFGKKFAAGVNGNFDGARAAGGPVSAGKSYLVGENGPELFQAGASGRIVPNHAMGGGIAQIVPSPYFDVVVDGRILSAAPAMIAAGGAAGVGRIQRMQDRRLG